MWFRCASPRTPRRRTNLEVELEGDAGTRRIPMPLSKVHHDKIVVVSIKSEHFPMVPKIASDSQVTLQEEERIGAFYAGGKLYADPKRLEPLL